MRWKRFDAQLKRVSVSKILEEIVAKFPHQKAIPNAPLQALIIDSWFDNYLGVLSLVRMKTGTSDKVK